MVHLELQTQAVAAVAVAMGLLRVAQVVQVS
jgi:hypothetical protein